MRYLLVVLLMLGLAGVAAATYDTTQIAPDKGTYVGDGAFDGREGGEGFGDAVVIGSLPYNDSGATCDNLNDITLGCAASAANDVVYVYTAAASAFVSVSLCGSSYDTALAIYDAGYNELFCNDDFCGLQSQIDFNATAGQTYYFVVDGFSTNCGSYVINVTSAGGPCDPSCPAGAQLEGEPPCGNDYVDSFNGGCNSTPPAWNSTICPQEGDGAVFCGMSGTYLYTGLNYRDTDWLIAYGTGGTMTASCCASFPLQLILIYGTDCNNLQYDLLQGQAYQEISLSRTIGNGVAAWIWVGPSVFDSVPCESPYLLTMSGINTGAGCEPVATESKTWGGIKSMYR